MVLGLAIPFTETELRSAARRRLFEIHPDTASVDGEHSVDDILEARRLLEAYLREKTPSPISTEQIGREDAAYRHYRAGVKILGEALDRYWKRRVGYSHLPESAPFYLEFIEEIKKAKEQFARVLDLDPGGLWTVDAVEEIARINVWLGM